MLNTLTEGVKNYTKLGFNKKQNLISVKLEAVLSSGVSACVSLSHMVPLDLGSAADKVRAEWDSICV